MSSELKAAIVIDVGSGVTKVGLASEIEPRHIYPSIVSYPKKWLNTTSIDIKIGETSGLHTPTYPIDHGVIRSSEDFEKLVEHSVDLLHVPKGEHPILLTHAMGAPKKDKEDKLELVLETLDAKFALIGNQSVLTLFAAGRTTGVVVDCGHGATLVVPIVDGRPIAHAVRNLEIGGCDLTESLLHSLSHCSESGSAWVAAVGKIKEAACYVALDFDSEKLISEEMLVEVPGRHDVLIESDRYKIPEMLFQRNGGLPQLILEAIMSCPDHLHNMMFQNIVVGGGTANLPGLIGRLEKNLKSLTAKDSKICIISFNTPERLSWYGGAALASLENLKMSPWITKGQYLEHGPSVVHTAPY